MCNPKNLGPGKSKKKQNKCNQKCEKYATSGNLFFCKTCTVPEFAFFLHCLFVCFAFSSSSCNFLNFWRPEALPKMQKCTIPEFAFFSHFFCIFLEFLQVFELLKTGGPPKNAKMHNSRICIFFHIFFAFLFAFFSIAFLLACFLQFCLHVVCIFWLHFYFVVAFFFAFSDCILFCFCFFCIFSSSGFPRS